MTVIAGLGTGLQNNLNRWYDAGTGGWLSQDPKGFAAGDANLYCYVGNGPIEKTDSSGLHNASAPSTVALAAEREARQLIRAAMDWNMTSPGATMFPDHMCAEQADALMHVLPGIKKDGFQYWSIAPTGSASGLSVPFLDESLISRLWSNKASARGIGVAWAPLTYLLVFCPYSLSRGWSKNSGAGIASS